MEKGAGRFLVLGVFAAIMLLSFASAGWLDDFFGKITGRATTSCLTNYDPVCCIIDGKSVTASNNCLCVSKGGSVSYTGVCIVPVSENVTCVFANVTGIQACWSNKGKCTSKGGSGNNNNCTITGVSGMTNDLVNWSTTCLGTPGIQSRLSGLSKRLTFNCGFVREYDTCIFSSDAGKQTCTSSKGKCTSSGLAGGNNCTLAVSGNRGEQVIWNSTCSPKRIQSVISGYNKSLEFSCTSVCLPATCKGMGKQCGKWDDACGGQIDCGTCGSANELCNSEGQCEAAACFDSDGRNYYTRGTNEFQGSSTIEICVGDDGNPTTGEEGTQVIETWCENNRKNQETYPCSDGCSGGACKETGDYIKTCESSVKIDLTNNPSVKLAFSWDDGTSSGFKNLKFTVISADGYNLVTIRDATSGEDLCVEKRAGSVCMIGGGEINIDSVWRDVEVRGVTLSAGQYSSFNEPGVCAGGGSMEILGVRDESAYIPNSKISVDGNEISVGGNILPLNGEVQLLHFSSLIVRNADESKLRDLYSSIDVLLSNEDSTKELRVNMPLSSVNCGFYDEAYSSDNIKVCALSFMTNIDFSTQNARSGEVYSLESPISGNKTIIAKFVDDSYYTDTFVLDITYLPDKLFMYSPKYYPYYSGRDNKLEYEASSAYHFGDRVYTRIEQQLAVFDSVVSAKEALNNLLQEVARDSDRFLTAFENINGNWVYLFEGKESRGSFRVAVWQSDNKVSIILDEKYSNENSAGTEIMVSKSEGSSSASSGGGGVAMGMSSEIENFVRALKNNEIVIQAKANYTEFGPQASELVGSYLVKYPSTINENESVCFSKWSCTINPVICPEYGMQVKKCVDTSGCLPSTEEELTCVPGICSGCMNDALNKCIPYGVRMFVDGVPSYCEIDGTMKAQRLKDPDGSWAKCQNSYECESNVCSAGECIEVQGMLDQAGAIKGLAIRVLCRFANLFKEDDYATCVAKYLGA